LFLYRAGMICYTLLRIYSEVFQMKKWFSLFLVLAICLSASAFAELDVYKDMIGSAIKLENYSDPEVDEYSATYVRKEAAVAAFDFVIAMDGGPVLELNGKTVYQDLLNSGWKSDMPETAEGYYSYFNSCFAPDESWISITLSNPTEGSMPIAETYVTGATISAGFSSDFDLSGICFDSTVADVVNAFGEPYRFYCSESSGLVLKYQDENYSSLIITFNAEGKLTEAAYSYNGSLYA